MLTTEPFYHEQIRKLVVAFGSLFSNIRLVRSDESGAITQTIKVPLAFTPKQKWVQRIDMDPTLSSNTYTVLPRMGFEIVGYSYDPERKTNRMGKVGCVNADGNTKKSAFAPAPWNIEISFYILTNNYEDGIQILEQILPYFQPEYTLGIKAIPELNIIQDIPIVLNSASVSDEYDGSFEIRRFVTHTLSFTIKTNIFGPVSTQGIIKKVIVDFTQQGMIYTAEADNPTAEIIETWIQEL